MPWKECSPAELAAVRKKFDAQADLAFEQMFGDDGQNGLVTLTVREDGACEVTDRRARWLREEHRRSPTLDRCSDRVDRLHPFGDMGDTSYHLLLSLDTHPAAGPE